MLLSRGDRLLLFRNVRHSYHANNTETDCIKHDIQCIFPGLQNAINEFEKWWNMFVAREGSFVKASPKVGCDKIFII